MSIQVSTYNSIAEDYARKVADKGPKKELKKFLSMIPEHSRVLDAGCAAGRDTIRISKKGFDVVGVDLSEKLLEIGRRMYPQLNLRLESVTNLSFEDETFDGVWAIGLLHEIDYSLMKKALIEFHRVLKQDGLIFIRTKKGKGSEVTDKDVLSKAERVVNFLEENQLVKLLRDSGFTCVEVFSQESPTRSELKWLCVYARKI